tara:strand:- start:364 stop:564 length:201 start_codon:yes stop_codon:yes gene_type:complete
VSSKQDPPGTINEVIMFDGFIYKLLDSIVNTCEKIREWMIQRSLPKGMSASEWAEKNAKSNKKSYK